MHNLSRNARCQPRTLPSFKPAQETEMKRKGLSSGYAPVGSEELRDLRKTRSTERLFYLPVNITSYSIENS